MIHTPPTAEYAPIDEAVEDRVRQLEHAVAALQRESAGLEERVVEKVTDRLKRSPVKALRESANSLLDAGKTAIAKGQAAGPDSAPWLIFELIGEIRMMFAMCFDRRYSFTTLGRFGPVVLLTLYVAGWFSIGLLPWIGWVLQRLYEAILIVLLYKLLRREGARYRQFLATT